MFVDHLHTVDHCVLWASVTPGNQGIDVGAGTLEDSRHRAVGVVGDPAGHGPALGLAPAGVTEEHALNPTRHAYAPSHHAPKSAGDGVRPRVGRRLSAPTSTCGDELDGRPQSLHHQTPEHRRSVHDPLRHHHRGHEVALGHGAQLGAADRPCPGLRRCGFSKLAGDPAMIELFAAIGAGQGLRYVVGTLEIAGAIGVLVPRLCGLAAAGLALLMIGATRPSSTSPCWESVRCSPCSCSRSPSSPSGCGATSSIPYGYAAEPVGQPPISCRNGRDLPGRSELRCVAAPAKSD